MSELTPASSNYTPLQEELLSLYSLNLEEKDLLKIKELIDEYLEKNGFYEIEISRKVEKFGSVYHVWSTYETRNTSDGPIIGRGINSVELFFDGSRFWIITWVFDDERKNNPIPSEYLTK